MASPPVEQLQYLLSYFAQRVYRVDAAGVFPADCVPNVPGFGTRDVFHLDHWSTSATWGTLAGILQCPQ